VKERKDRVDDALHATRAAVEEGIVPGGGTALLYASKALDGLSGENDDQTRGIDIVRRALIRSGSPDREPTPARRCGCFGQADSTATTKTFGFNAADRHLCDLVSAGVIDPTKVVRTAPCRTLHRLPVCLSRPKHAIADKPEDKSSAPAMPDMGGMGGMGGMGF
jgi:chaperonin GroEL